MLGKVIAISSFVLALQGCYIDPTSEDRLPIPGEYESQDLVGQCRVGLSTGCFEGQVIASPSIRVSGKEFFDATELAMHFDQLVAVQSPEGSKLRGEDYQLDLVTRLDNDAFVKDFHVYMKGEYTRDGIATPNGKIFIHRLPPGEYNVRVQKDIRFDVVTKVAAIEGSTEETELRRPFCATLYQDMYVEILAGQQARPVFDDFNLHVTDANCGKTGPSQVVTVNP